METPLARALNERLERAAPEVLAMLSPLGRRLYMPRGIISQGQEAKERAHRVNATVGIATEGAGPMHLPSIQSHLPDLNPADAYPYAPTAGRPSLRERWREKLLTENPSLRGKRFGVPVVTAAITHGLSLAADLFAGEGDAVLVPDKLWGNYRLLFEVRYGARIESFPFYTDDLAAFDQAGFERALDEQAARHEKLIVLLNFPNNPTGYMPTPEEGEAIVRALVARAEAGTRVVALYDDAYFGLFYHLGGESMVESLFGLSANEHPNLLSVKLDGATKELFVWGLRCGFITLGPGNAASADEVCDVLDEKLRGAIRGAVSNVGMLSQTLVEKALMASSLADERKEKCEVLRTRAAKVFQVVNAPRFRESWKPYPFNSGYFMCLRVNGVDAERLRVHLLDAYGVGLVATGPHDLRVAFSCVEVEQIEPLFETLHKAIQELRED